MYSSSSPNIKNRLPNFAPLLFNHMDAWGITAVIVIAALFIHQQLNADGFILVALVTVTYWLGFALNDYFDASLDAQDSGKAGQNFFVQTPIKKKTAIIGFLIVIMGLFIGYANFNTRGIFLFLFCFPIAWAYSAPPFRLKSIPGLDLLTHALFVETLPYLTTLFLLAQTPSLLDVLAILTLLLASLSAQLEQQSRDFAIDVQFERNFTTTFGVSLSGFLIRLFSLAIVIVFLFGMLTKVAPLEFLPFGIITMPLFVYRFFRQNEPRPPKLVKFSTLAALGYAGILTLLTLT